MVTTAELVRRLGLDPVSVVVAGEDRRVARFQLVEPGAATTVAPGDLVIAVGVRSVDDALGLLDGSTGAAGLVLRSPWARDEQVRERCDRAGLTLVEVAEDTAWSVVVERLRAALEDGGDNGTAYRLDLVYADLFGIADKVSAVIGGPVTIEDATSRVLAYSTGQESADAQRMSTIIGRQVPAEVRRQFRSLGVFRHLARSDEPYFLPASSGTTKPRYVLPVRVAGEWLGSVWAVVDAPLTDIPDAEIEAAVEAIGLCLLRIRAQGELHRQVRRDHLRAALAGETGAGADWLEPGPWRVVSLAAPTADPAVDARCEMWLALARRHGWSVPLIADLDGGVYAILRSEGTAPGSWEWMTDLVVEGAGGMLVACLTAGSPVATIAELATSRAQADELLRVAPEDTGTTILAVEDSWPMLVLGRAIDGLQAMPPVSPVSALVEHDRVHGSGLVDTLTAVIDYWGEPQRAARVLGVHANTIRNRMARVVEVCALDLQDPEVRLAARLEIARVRRER